jgi:hypothetical protein
VEQQPVQRGRQQHRRRAEVQARILWGSEMRFSRMTCFFP